MKKPYFLILTFLLVTTHGAFAQDYLSDLLDGNVDKATKKMELLDLNISKEPVIPRYIESGGSDQAVLEQLLAKGANINALSPTSGVNAVYIAVNNSMDPRLVEFLLSRKIQLQGKSGSGGLSLIDYCFENRLFEYAVPLYQANLKLPVKSQLPIGKNSLVCVSVLKDDVSQAKKIITGELLPRTWIWSLAIRGNSTKVVKLLTDLERITDLQSEKDISFLFTERPLLLDQIIKAVGKLNYQQSKQFLDIAYGLKNKVAYITVANAVPVILQADDYVQALIVGLDAYEALSKKSRVFDAVEKGYESGITSMLYLNNLALDMWNGNVPEDEMTYVLDRFFPDKEQQRYLLGKDESFDKYFRETFATRLAETAM